MSTSYKAFAFAMIRIYQILSAADKLVFGFFQFSVFSFLLQAVPHKFRTNRNNTGSNDRSSSYPGR